MILEEKLAFEAGYFVRIAGCEYSSWRGIRAHRRRIDLSKPSTSSNDQYCKKGGDHRFFLEKVGKTAGSHIRPYAPVFYRGHATYDLLRQVYGSRSSANAEGCCAPPLPNTSTRPPEVAGYGR